MKNLSTTIASYADEASAEKDWAAVVGGPQPARSTWPTPPWSPRRLTAPSAGSTDSPITAEARALWPGPS